jgi:bifunctional DNA-binding transcriptional regulator/antitoxin component of YhaV-PrlF toxin-antitoxin module
MHHMTGVHTLKVASLGQVTLPLELRHRWGVEHGGDLAVIDLGDAVLLVPGGAETARRELRRVLRARYETGRAAVAEPDLADQ